MNILIYFSKPLNPYGGGTERVAYIIYNYLTRIGHNVMEMPRLPDESEGDSVANVTAVNDVVERNDIEAIINESANSDAIFLFSHKHIPQHIKIITHLHFDIYGDIRSFYLSYYLPIFGVRLSDSLSNIARWMKMPYNKWNAKKWKKRRYRYMFDNSDHIVLLTENLVSDFNRLIKTGCNSKSLSINNPVSYESSKDYVEKENIAIFVGRLEYPKRVDRILRAWSLIQKKNKNWKLCIVGDGSDKNRLMDLSKTLKLRNVSFTGQNDPVPYYEKAKLLMLTSNYEGTPMVIYEAMSHGVVPIVMDSFSSVHQMIDDGIDGIITKSFDIKELAEASIHLIDNPSKLQEISNHAEMKIKNIDNNKILREWDILLK